MQEVQAKRPPYRPLTIQERDLLFALYEKWNGNLSEMVLDKDCVFKAYNQIHYYKHFYHFREKLIDIRRKRTEDINKRLNDGKTRAIEQAMRILESHNVFVYNKSGTQVFDSEGNPLIVEKLPYYKEIKTAWEIIKTELGEPTTIAKTEGTLDIRPLANINFKIANEPTKPREIGGDTSNVATQS